MSTGTHPTAHPTRGIKINNELACANAEATLTLVPVGITDGNFWQSPDMVGWTFSLLLGTRMSHHHCTQLFSPERVHYRNIISISSVDTIKCCGLKSTCVNFGVYGHTVVAQNPPRLPSHIYGAVSTTTLVATFTMIVNWEDFISGSHVHRDTMPY